MDYKNTLNLPRTDFPMKADLIAREPERLKKWEKTGLYEKIQAARAQAKEKFVLHDGPPFANGDVHIGTALNKILKDIIIKYKSLRGFNAPYVPGWDCHGLPIEFKVSQDMRKAGDTSTDAATIRKRRAVVQDKFLLCLGTSSPDFLIKPGFFPLFQAFRLAGDEVGLHGEIGVRQV